MGRKLTILVCWLTIAALMAPPAGSAPGVERRRIKIGIHAPLTGAAPVPARSVQEGVEIYWRWLRRKNRPVHRRHIRVILKNDQYNPSAAVASCREMVEEQRVFMLATFQGGHGAPQIEACARYAGTVGVPYVSLGASEAGLRSSRQYFALSATLERQAQLLASHLLDKGAEDETNGLVFFDRAPFHPFADAFTAAMEREGAEISYRRALSRNSGTEEARTTVAEMELAGIENAVVLVTPVFWLNLLKQAGTSGFDPLWTGPGPTSTHDVAANVACEDAASPRARFLSPLPAFVDRDRFDPTFDRAYRAFYSGAGDDFVWLGWAFSKALRDMLDEAGRHLTRRTFVTRNENGDRLRTGILPPVTFTRRDHFGGRGTHLLRLDCDEKRWETKRTFVRRF